MPLKGVMRIFRVLGTNGSRTSQRRGGGRQGVARIRLLSVAFSGGHLEGRRKLVSPYERC